MRRLLAELDAEDRLVGAGVGTLTVAGATVHIALGLAVLGTALVCAGIALARRAA